MHHTLAALVIGSMDGPYIAAVVINVRREIVVELTQEGCGGNSFLLVLGCVCQEGVHGSAVDCPIWEHRSFDKAVVVCIC